MPWKHSSPTLKQLRLPHCYVYPSLSEAVLMTENNMLGSSDESMGTNRALCGWRYGHFGWDACESFWELHTAPLPHCMSCDVTWDLPYAEKKAPLSPCSPPGVREGEWKRAREREGESCMASVSAVLHAVPRIWQNAKSGCVRAMQK